MTHFLLDLWFLWCYNEIVFIRRLPGGSYLKAYKFNISNS